MEQGTTMRSGELATCLIGGAHYFLLPPAGRTRPTVLSVEGHCKHCGLEQAFPTRPRGRRRGQRATQTARAESPRRFSLGGTCRGAADTRG